MRVQIKYAYLKDQTWMFRRNYPADVALVLGSKALKQSLKTSDAKIAKLRAVEVNRKYEANLRKSRSGMLSALAGGPQSQPLADSCPVSWDDPSRDAIGRLRAALEAEELDLSPVAFINDRKARKIRPVGDLSKVYLRKRGNELRPGGFKSVRYSIGLFTSKFRDRPVGSLTRDDGRVFLSLVGQLSRVIGKSGRSKGLGLDELVAFSRSRRDWIGVRTQKRIWSQVNHFLDWAVYEGELAQNPFRTVRFDQKVRPAPYAVPTDEEVARLLGAADRHIHDVLLFCLLSGMRAGEAAGLLRDDLVAKGNLGWFANVRPNAIRALKTDASERLVPMHSVLEGLLTTLPAEGPLFPDLTVNMVTKRFAELRQRLDLARPGLVFHSTRKWFITQCERTGVPEHFTASIVGHQSARSENKLTYSIYSAGISDEQKRAIVDQIRLPVAA